MSEFPQKLVEMLARKVADGIKKNTKGLRLTTKEREHIVNCIFTQVLKEYAKPEDWTELKSAVGKKMNQWRQEKELLKEAREALAEQEASEEKNALSGLYPESSTNPDG
ncbi:MAG TPA: hypothetical protein DD454_04120 [Candidatus Moranbacteria bacterium]|nr:hypothetical protein [Candidatus Moranbacteria bacterium]